MKKSSNRENYTLTAWRRLSSFAGGKWLFGRIVCWKAPYFATIRPQFVDVRPGHCEVRMKIRRAILNHIGTVHAIAMCNLAELAGGTMTEVTIPGTHRWIPAGMSVEYLRKAQTDLVAVAIYEFPSFSEVATEVRVPVSLLDTRGEIVFHAEIRMHVSMKA